MNVVQIVVLWVTTSRRKMLKHPPGSNSATLKVLALGSSETSKKSHYPTPCNKQRPVIRIKLLWVSFERKLTLSVTQERDAYFFFRVYLL